MNKFKEEIIRALLEKLSEHLTREEIEKLIEKPKDFKMGDYAFPCFILSKKLKKSPNQISQEINSELILNSDLIEKNDSVNQYINFFINKENLFSKIISEIIEKKDTFGTNEIGNNKNVVVEYSSPNTNKPLHIGHVRNNTIGMAISNVLKECNYNVFRTAIINDRGAHICKSMLAYQKFGEGKTPESENIKGDHFVGNYYVLFSKMNSEKPELKLEDNVKEMLLKWEAKDPKIISLWKKMNSWVYDGFKKTYKDYECKFEKWYYESDLYDKGKLMVDEGVSKGVFEKEDDAIIVNLDKFKLPKKVLLRSDGTALYATQDLYLSKVKYQDYKMDKSFVIVGSDQDLYQEQIKRTLELLNYPFAKNRIHISYGMVNLVGGKMKSREGTVVYGDDLLTEMKELAKSEVEKRYPNLSSEEIDERVNKISLAAIKFYMLRMDKIKDITYDPTEAISFEGETGPYLLYTYARAKSILRKENISGIVKGNPKHELEKELLGILSKYPKIIIDTEKTLSMHTLCHYLIKVGSTFNSFYHELPVLKSTNEKEMRLWLVSATSQVLKNGLAVLGIKTLEEM